MPLLTEDQLEHDCGCLLLPRPKQKIDAALNALNRTLAEPAHATTPLKVLWLLQTPISPSQPLSL